jgi:predicted metal-binding membrane protein
MHPQLDVATRASRSRAAGERCLIAACVAIFLISVAITIRLCDSSCCESLPIPGGWTLSTMWTRTAGGSWLGAAGSFLAMWSVMMAAMMLPCIAPMLVQYRRSLHATGADRSHGSTMLVSAGYFAVWTLVGAAVFSIGAAFASIALHSPSLARSVPLLSGGMVVLAGVIQLSPWKIRQMMQCRTAPSCAGAACGQASSSWRHGLALGAQCARCCSGLMLALLALGLMDLRAMTIITSAMAAERLAPTPVRIARSIGMLAIAAGACSVALALGSD